ncbi:MAG: hypothetical protein H7123_05765 [Thermoleophilia bacterium]|nr:hypothetical protein [Thermoleophilia bacterium]
MSAISAATAFASAPTRGITLNLGKIALTGAAVAGVGYAVREYGQKHHNGGLDRLGNAMFTGTVIGAASIGCGALVGGIWGFLAGATLGPLGGAIMGATHANQ